MARDRPKSESLPLGFARRAGEVAVGAKNCGFDDADSLGAAERHRGLGGNRRRGAVDKVLGPGIEKNGQSFQRSALGHGLSGS